MRRSNIGRTCQGKWAAEEGASVDWGTLVGTTKEGRGIWDDIWIPGLLSGLLSATCSMGGHSVKGRPMGQSMRSTDNNSVWWPWCSNPGFDQTLRSVWVGHERTLVECGMADKRPDDWFPPESDRSSMQYHFEGMGKWQVRVVSCQSRAWPSCGLVPLDV